MTVYSYARSSDIEDLDAGGDSRMILERENLQLNTFALSRGLRIDETVQDRGLKWTQDFAERPGASRLLERLEEGDAVVAGSLQRIFGNSEDMTRTVKALRKMRVSLLLVDLGGDLCDPDFRPPFSRVMRCFRELEKRRARERIKTVKENQRRKGRFLGGSRPFGYMIHSNGRLIENPMEQRVLKKIFEMKNQGKSLRAISAEVSTPMMPISFKTVQRLIKRHEQEQSEREKVQA